MTLVERRGKGARGVRQLPSGLDEQDFAELVNRRERDARSDTPPPHDLEAEKAVLGALILDPDLFPLVDAIVRADDFYHPAHAAIYRAMSAVAGRSQPFDVLTISDELRTMERLNSVGGMQYLGELTESTPTTLHVERYAEIVVSRRGARDFARFGMQLYDAAMRGGRPDELAVLASGFLASGVRTSQKLEAQSLEAITRDEYDRIVGTIERRDRGERPIDEIPTGLASLDAAIGGGTQRTHLIVIAARPAMGKSALAGELLFLSSQATGDWSVFFALEMTCVELQRRYITGLSGVPNDVIRRAAFTEEQMDAYNHAGPIVSSVPVFVVDAAGQTLAAIRSTCVKLKARAEAEGKRLGLVAVDYLQLMEAEGAGGATDASREQFIARVSRGLKVLAKDLDVTILCLSQLNRSLESRSDKRPMLSDLRESGAIEQDANQVWFIYRDEVYDKQSPDKGVAEIIIGKQRDGKPTTVRLAFDGARTWFSEFADEDPRRFEVPYIPPERGGKRGKKGQRGEHSGGGGYGGTHDHASGPEDFNPSGVDW